MMSALHGATVSRCACALLCALVPLGAQRPPADFEALPFAPRSYVCYRAPSPLDHRRQARRTGLGRGALDRRVRRHRRRQASAAAIPDPREDAVGRRVFLRRRRDGGAGRLGDADRARLGDLSRQRLRGLHRPDGDTHEYYELEVNALATPWDLMLIKPYRDGGPAINGWEIAGLQVGVDVRGTHQRPGDRDEGWTVELAMPWKILREAAPDHRAPKAGDRWRVNFSRVEWQVDVVDGRYVKRLEAREQGSAARGQLGLESAGRRSTCTCPSAGATSSSRPRQRRPAPDTFVDDRERDASNGRYAVFTIVSAPSVPRTAVYATTLEALNASDIRVEGLDFRPSLQATPTMYQITRARIRRGDRCTSRTTAASG